MTQSSSLPRDHQPFSVLLPVHGSDDATHFRVALRSVLDQTVPPGEVVIVADESVDESLQQVVEDSDLDGATHIRLLSLDGRVSLGPALREGVLACSHDTVARMDADDIAVSDRFERQLNFLAENPVVDVVGGYVAEFDDDPESPSRVRKVPTTPDDVRRWARFRCPVNHPTVMFDKTTVLEVGNYRNRPSLEDYDLWVRVLLNDGAIANLDQVLVKMRIRDMFEARRGGLAYLRSEWDLLREFHEQGFIGWTELVVNLLSRAPVRLAPAAVRRHIYEKLLR